MQISGFQSTSTLFTALSSSSTTQASNTSNSQNTFGAALSNLMSAIKSGDTTDAEKYLSQVQQLAPSNADPNSPLGKFLSNVSTDLSNNNISGAQNALSTLEAQRASSASDSSSTSSANSLAGSNGSSAFSAFGQDVLSLFSAISSGNLSNAQSSYDSLTSLLLGNGSSTSASSSSTTGNSSSLFGSLLSQIGSALGSGDVSSAQSALDSFLQNLSTGSIVSTTA